jgi:hypothetical protein
MGNGWKYWVGQLFSVFKILITEMDDRPWIGGSLARPSDRFPALFGGQFWKQYPYFLPCLCVAVIVAVCFATTLFFFNEVSQAGFGSSSLSQLPLDRIRTNPSFSLSNTRRCPAFAVQR